MSHLLKEYSKNLEVEPSGVVVNRHFYPMIADDYIVIYNEQDISAKKYRYYSLVIDLIKKALDPLGVKVVMIGSGKDLSDRVDYVLPNLSFRTNAYIVSKAKVLVCVDNAISQYASTQKVPIVNLYGNIYSSITTPYWSNKKNKIDLEPKWNKKPCLSLQDPEDSINKIPAEKVAESILKLLLPQFKTSTKINPTPNFKTKLINKKKDFCVDVVPLNYVNIPLINDNIINLRLDYGAFNDASFYQYCMNHKCNLILKNAVIQPSVINNFLNNLNSFNLILTEQIDEIPKKYFDYFKRNNIEFNIFVQNKEILDAVRFQYFDLKVEEYSPPTKKPKEVDLGDKFFSFKMVVEGDKIYKSTYHWKKNIDNEDNIVDNADYWEELDYFYIYEQDRT